MLATRTSARSCLIATLCAAAAAAAGCGNATAPGASSTATSARASLDLTVTSHPGAVPVHWTLRCDPPGGTHPDPAAACQILLAAKAPFAAVPKHVMCPMIVANPKKATITGTWFGKPVNLTLTDGGCTLGRWHEFGKVLG